MNCITCCRVLSDFVSSLTSWRIGSTSVACWIAHTVSNSFYASVMPCCDGTRARERVSATSISFPGLKVSDILYLCNLNSIRCSLLGASMRGLQRLVITLHTDFSTVCEMIKMLHPKNNNKKFFFYLLIVTLGSRQGTASVRHGPSISSCKRAAPSAVWEASHWRVVSCLSSKKKPKLELSPKTL